MDKMYSGRTIQAEAGVDAWKSVVAAAEKACALIRDLGFDPDEHIVEDYEQTGGRPRKTLHMTSLGAYMTLIYIDPISSNRAEVIPGYRKAAQEWLA